MATEREIHPELAGIGGIVGQGVPAAPLTLLAHFVQMPHKKVRGKEQI